LFQDLGSKLKNNPIACWHRKVKPDEVISALRTVSGTLYFKCEPPILHIAAKDIESANKLLIAARECGFKHSGIQSIKPNRVVIEIASTEVIDVPIMEDGQLFVTEKYLKYLTRLANKKQEKSKLKIRKLEKMLKEI
jgi:tRNA wybutosine-synthesizing protein 3